MDELTITKTQLQAAILQWVQDSRDGKTRSHDETGALSAEQVAQESTDHLWAELSDEVGS